MKNKIITVTVLLVSLLCFSFCNSGVGKSTPAAEIKWMTWEQVEEAQKTKPKKVFVDVYTDWCGWCKKMDKTTFENPVIVGMLNKDYYCIKFNAESRNPITLKGQTFENKGRYHDIAIAYMGQNMGFPTSMYLDENMKPLTQPIASYLDPKQLEQILTFFGGNHYLTTPYETFVKTFKGKVE